MSCLKLVRTIFKIIFLSLTSDECQAWFHLNAASSAARNTEQVNITNNLEMVKVGFEQPHRKEPAYKSIVLTARPMNEENKCQSHALYVNLNDL